MDTPEKPKKRESLASLGWLLMIGGIFVLRHAVNTQTYYCKIHADGSVAWAFGVAILMILGGGALLLAVLVRKFRSRG